MVLEEDRWPGVVGPFIVSKDGTPVSHSAVRVDDPDLAVMKAYTAATDRTRKARMAFDQIGDAFRFYNCRDAEDVPGATVRAMRELLSASDKMWRALVDERDALRDWAKVLQRLGFKDAFGIDHPLPAALTQLLDEENGDAG